MRTYKHKKEGLSQKQQEVLKLCPDGEFLNKALSPKDREFLYPLVRKGYLLRWKCVDPCNKSTTYRMTEQGMTKKKELIEMTGILI